MQNLPRIYLITDRTLFTAETDFLLNLEQLLTAGLRMVQLREKDLSARQLYHLALKVRQLTSAYDAKFLINDRIDVALAVQADGIHLGGHSLPAACARNILGSHAIIGVSTHNEQEIATAQDGPADFITFGPVYHTPSKADYGQPQGIDRLLEICTKVAMPVYALGGVKPENTSQVRTAGSYGVAAISALQSGQPVMTLRRFSAALQR